MKWHNIYDKQIIISNKSKFKFMSQLINYQKFNTFELTTDSKYSIN